MYSLSLCASFEIKAANETSIYLCSIFGSSKSIGTFSPALSFGWRDSEHCGPAGCPSKPGEVWCISHWLKGSSTNDRAKATERKLWTVYCLEACPSVGRGCHSPTSFSSKIPKKPFKQTNQIDQWLTHHPKRCPHCFRPPNSFGPAIDGSLPEASFQRPSAAAVQVQG